MRAAMPGLVAAWPGRCLVCELQYASRNNYVFCAMSVSILSASVRKRQLYKLYVVCGIGVCVCFRKRLLLRPEVYDFIAISE